jgi:hypothetical protein
MRRFLKENSLGVAFGLMFVVALVGQAVAGHAAFNEQQVADGLPAVTMLRYLSSSDFAGDIAENWQSEYLQFFLYVVLTVWLVQKGSPESKKPQEVGLESDEQQKVGQYAGDDSPPGRRSAASGGFCCRTRWGW